MLRLIGRLFNINLRYSWNCDHCTTKNDTWVPLGTKFPATLTCGLCLKDNTVE
jgi:hypothetical protein